ncbi:uncharacterized protein [Lepisosteus oculatus]|uniref:uncharacterized protein n=1 Tax=Lepisosteus oculatus TaxID=7918 RepID=UPI0037152F16
MIGLLLLAFFQSFSSHMLSQYKPVQKGGSVTVPCYYTSYVLETIEYCCVGKTPNACEILMQKNKNATSILTSSMDPELYLCKMFLYSCFNNGNNSTAVMGLPDIPSVELNPSTRVDFMILLVTVGVTLAVLVPALILILKTRTNAEGGRKAKSAGVGNGSSMANKGPARDSPENVYVIMSPMRSPPKHPVELQQSLSRENQENNVYMSMKFQEN